MSITLKSVKYKKINKIFKKSIDYLMVLWYYGYRKERDKMEIKIKLLDLTTNKEFYKYFETEFERDKFIRRLRYSKKLRLLDNCKRIDDN